MEYQKHEFCESIKCRLLDNLKEGKKTACLFCDAYKFHNYLQEQGYKIIKAGE